MLVLSRKTEEKIILTNGDGDDIVITVVELDRGRVKLGISAPPDVKIYRDELLGRLEGRKQKEEVAPGAVST